LNITYKQSNSVIMLRHTEVLVAWHDGMEPQCYGIITLIWCSKCELQHCCYCHATHKPKAKV